MPFPTLLRRSHREQRARVPLAALGIVSREGVVQHEIGDDEAALLGRAMPMPMGVTVAPGELEIAAP